MVFTLVYICFLIDLVIGNVITINDLFGILDFKFLKNCLFYSFFCSLVIKQSISIAFSTQSNYYSSVENLDELTETVLLKIRIIRVNSILVCFYTLSYIIGNIFIAIHYSKSNSICANVFNLFIDFIVLFISLFNLKPHRLLFLYETVALTFEEFNIVYKVKIIGKKVVSLVSKLLNYENNEGNSNKKKNIKLSISKDLSSKELKKIKEEENSIILILNPYLPNKIRSSRNSLVINKSDESNTSISSKSSFNDDEKGVSNKNEASNHSMSNMIIGKIIL